MRRRTDSINHHAVADLTVREVADELHVTTSSVYRLIHDGVLPAYCPLGHGVADPAARRTLRVTRADLDRHKAGNSYEPPADAAVAPPHRRPRLADHPMHQDAMEILRRLGAA